MTDHTPLTTEQLADIEARAAEHRAALSGWLNCYSPLPEQEALEGAEGVLEKAVPALLAEVRRLRDRNTELEVGLNDLARLVSQWHNRAAAAEARVAGLEPDSALLAALYAAGVDNWEGYDNAREEADARAELATAAPAAGESGSTR